MNPDTLIAPGRNPVMEALRSAHLVTNVFLESGMRLDPKIEEIKQLASARKVSVQEVTTKQLDRLAGKEHHQGVVAEVEFKLASLSDHIADSLYIYIREAQYEQNVGAIIRTAEVAGIGGVILPPKQEITPTIVRISMGAIFHIPIYQASLFPCIKAFKQQGAQIAALERGGTNLFASQLWGITLMIVGGEDRSISKQIADQCDITLSIPQHGKVNSLNMSAASAIAIFEYVRQSGNS